MGEAYTKLVLAKLTRVKNWALERRHPEYDSKSGSNFAANPHRKHDPDQLMARAPRVH
jgi:hypothetical protein